MASTQREIAQLMADVTPWYKDPGRRKLYALLLIALLSSATNGYDGYIESHNLHSPITNKSQIADERSTIHHVL